MGMLPESIHQWGAQQARTLTVQGEALDRNFWISGVAKFVRLVTQIVVLGWGAHLALAGELTAGMMIAASIIAGRALQPLEGMIEGWRTFVQTRSAYGARQPGGRVPAEREAEAAPAQARGQDFGRTGALHAARLEGAGPERRLLRAPARAVAGDRRSLGLGQIDPGAHPGRMPHADGGQGAARRHGAAQLGPTAVRRIHRLSCRRRSSSFPAPSPRTSVACATACPTRASTRPPC